MKNGKQLFSVNEGITDDVTQFIESIAVFENFSFYITSFDLFCHNQVMDDDCAFGLSLNEITKVPVAKIKTKTAKKVKFYELSLYIGLYELLVTGGYMVKNDSGSSNVIPFLGSSITFEEEGNEKATNDIFSRTEAASYINTPRLLQQYIKNQSRKPWVYHSLSSYTKGFTPILPIDFGNHMSQRNKAKTIHHFASRLLFIIYDRNPITKEIILDLWFLVRLVGNFSKVISKSSPQQPVNIFNQLHSILEKLEDGPIYFKFLVKVAKEIEDQVNERSYYFFCVNSNINAKSIALKIVQEGLKDNIKRRNGDLIKAEKKSLA